MGSLQLLESNVWRRPIPWVKEFGSWYRGKKVHVYQDGSWKLIYQQIPSNMIVMYGAAGDIPSSYTIQNGSGGTHSFTGCFPYCDTATLLSNVGSDVHVANGHGTWEGTSGTSANSKTVQYRSFNANYWHTNDSTHGHVSNHSHGDTPSIIPEYIEAIPTLPTGSDTEIAPGALFMSASIDLSTLVNWAFWAAVTSRRCLRFGSTGWTTGGSSLHSHSPTGNSFIAHLKHLKNSWQGSYSHWYDHYHALGGNSHSDNNSPSRGVMGMFEYSGPVTTNLQEVPIGAHALFTSATLPAGWSHASGMNALLIELVPSTSFEILSGTISGSSIHETGAATHTLHDAPVNSNVAGLDGGNERYRYTGANHGHTVGSHVHPNPSNIIPYSVRLYLGYRTT